MFDRLLLISAGRTLYFGDIGSQGKVVTQYFENHGARSRAPEENFAEWVIQVTAEQPSSEPWTAKWRASEEYERLQGQLTTMRGFSDRCSPVLTAEYATSQLYQIVVLTRRTFSEAWRTPSYIWGRTLFYTGVVIVSHSARLNTNLTLIGHLDRFLFLEFTKFTAGTPKSAVFDLFLDVDV